jgi:hypothetical protein
MDRSYCIHASPDAGDKRCSRYDCYRYLSDEDYESAKVKNLPISYIDFNSGCLETYSGKAFGID